MPRFISLLFCALLLSLSASSLMGEDTIAANVIVLGQMESPDAQALFVVSREVGVPAPRDIISVHELQQVIHNDDGSWTRTYRDEPCLLFIDLNHDHKFMPNERRWKTPADHVCNVSNLPGFLDLDINDEAKTVKLTWHVPGQKRHEVDVHTLEVRNQLPYVEHHTQLPNLE